MNKFKFALPMIANFSASILMAIQSLYTSWIFVKFLHSIDFSIFAAFLILQTIFICLDFGAPTSLIRLGSSSFLGHKRSEYAALNMVQLISIYSLILSCLLLIYLLLIDFVPYRSDSSSLLTSILVTTAVLPKIVYTGILSYIRGKDQHITASIVVVLGCLLRIISATLVAVMYPQIDVYLFIINVIGVLEVVFVYFIAFRKFPSSSFTAIKSGAQEFAENLKFNMHIFLGSLVGVIYSNADKLYIKSLSSVDIFNQYFIYSIISGLIYLASAPISQYYVGRLTSSFAIDRAAKTLVPYVKITLWITFSLLLIVAVAPVSILYLWYGFTNANSSTSVLLIMSCAMFLNVMSSILGSIQVAIKKAGLFLWANLISFILLLSLLNILDARQSISISAILFICNLFILGFQYFFLIRFLEKSVQQAIKIFLFYVPPIIFLAAYGLLIDSSNFVYIPSSYIEAGGVLFWVAIICIIFSHLYYIFSLWLVRICDMSG